MLSFQACPDVSGTESTGKISFSLPFFSYSFCVINFFCYILVEELTCLATWKDGNSRYLVGLVSHHHAVSNEERYRCFVYEKILGSNGKFSFYVLFKPFSIFFSILRIVT